MEKVINGFILAKEIKIILKEKVEFYKKKLNLNPCLVVVMVGENPASEIYVRNKEKACEFCGIQSKKYLLKTETTEKELLNLIEELNKDADVNGILVQLPLPKHINENTILNAISYLKDVDAFNPTTVGNFFVKGRNDDDDILPCTAKGCLKLIKTVESDLKGKKAVVVGRSNIVGKPMAQLLLNEDMTVTMVHSKTKNLEEETKQADILVVAIGKAKFIKKEMIKNGAIIIDVGINRTEDGICGDVDFDDVYEKCSYISPVPRGAGPMTIACLLENLINLFKKQNNINE